jgi:N-acetylmuramoyl-L-alanine amidase
MTRVYLAVGHGLKPDGTYDPGAAGGGTDEQRAGDVVVKSAADTLRGWNVLVRDEAFQDDPNFAGTDDLVRAWKADLLVAVHHDWIKAGKGFFALWYRENGRLLGKVIEANVARAGFALRDYPLEGYRSDLSILKTVGSIPVTLVECGRIGEYTPEQLRQLGVAIAHGIAEYAGVKTEEDDMFTDQDRELLKEVSKKLDRSFLSDVARSYDWLLEAARDAGDAAEIERLKAKRADKLVELRAALGLD